MGKCKCKTEVYSRVVGYYRPVQEWNVGKQAEFHDRVPFNLATAKKHIDKADNDEREEKVSHEAS